MKTTTVAIGLLTVGIIYLVVKSAGEARKTNVSELQQKFNRMSKTNYAKGAITPAARPNGVPVGGVTIPNDLSGF